MADTTSAASSTADSASGALSQGWAAGTIKAAAAITLLVALVTWLAFLWHAFHAPVGQYDFSSYYAAALAIRLDPHANIYSATVMAGAGARAHVQVQPPLPYTYPPLMAIVLSPFTLLSFRVAARLWLLMNAMLCLVVVAVLGYEIARAAGATVPAPLRGLRAWLNDPIGLLSLALAGAVTLAAAPVRQTMLTGQIDLLVLLPLAFVPSLLHARRDAWAGAAVALAATLKLTPGLLLLYFILRGRWRAFWAALATLASLSLASIAIVGPSVFFASIPQALAVGSSDAVLGQNEALAAPISGALATSWPAFAPYARPVTYATLTVLALALGWLIWRPGRGATAHASSEQRTQDALTYGIALCGVLLLVPTAWVHHYVWVLPAVALAIGALLAVMGGARAPMRRVGVLAAILLLAAVLLDMSLPYSWDTQPHPAVNTFAGLAIRPLLLEARAMGTVLVVAVLGFLALRAPGVRRVRDEAT